MREPAAIAQQRDARRATVELSAMIFSSTEIKTGSATTPTVVLSAGSPRRTLRRLD